MSNRLFFDKYFSLASLTRAFILLIVLFALFGILSWLLAFFVYGRTNCGDRIRSISNARNIALALKAYAVDHDGNLPQGNTATEVFSKLLPVDKDTSGYIMDKSVFYVIGSEWTPKPLPENDPNPSIVSKEQNHWALMSGYSINDPKNAHYPLIFDGPANPEGKYHYSPNEKGGYRNGKSAIVVRADGSAKLEQLKEQYITTDGKDNILQPTDTWIPGGKLLMPW